MPHDNQELTVLLRREMEGAGPLSFALFMDLALYHPIHGYYQKSLKQIGCQGDFFTSVTVGNLFGRLLAFRFASWIEALEPLPAAPPQAPLLPPPGGTPSAVRFQLVEAGAHDGRLACDILTWFQGHRPDLFNHLEYRILEPSLARRAAQAESLAQFSSHLRWSSGWDEFPPGGVRGVIFSNEFLDAFPVHRLGWSQLRQSWFEWKVGWVNDRFAWVKVGAGESTGQRNDLQAYLGEAIPEALLAVLPDGFTIDVCPAATAWWTRAAQALSTGILLTFDYGLEALELFAPHRKEGTLRSYQKHQLTSDPLAVPGTQDLTAHINFTAIQAAGERAGLKTQWFGRQGTFLTGIAGEALGETSRFGAWTPAETRQLQSLTHPEFLGRSFQVLVQSR